eukprot:5234116-Pyramimonas_sp.AAC.1
MNDISKASNSTTSRHAHKRKFAKNEEGEMERTIRLRSALQGPVDLGAFGAETFLGTARRSSQRLFASAAACQKQWAIASLDINMASLEGLTVQGLTGATGEKERVACFTSPPGSAAVRYQHGRHWGHH